MSGPSGQPMSVEDIPVGDEYGDMHKIVLQGMMASGFLDFKGVKTLFTAACDYLRVSEEEKAIRTSMPYVQKVVRMINDQIKPFDMAIRSASCELSGRKYFLFMVTVEKSTMKCQTIFTKLEIEMFQLCLDRMMRKYPNFSLPLAECINILRELDPRASLSQADEFIQRMIDQQYFTKYMLTAIEYDVTLGVRGIREFEPLLVDLYRDVVQCCSLCKMSLLHGYRCPKCKMLLHKPCYTKYVQTCKTCQRCKTPWVREKDMIRRTRITDEIIEIEGPDVDLSGFKPSQSSKTHSALKSQQLAAASRDDADAQPMPHLEPMVSSRRTKKNSKK